MGFPLEAFGYLKGVEGDVGWAHSSCPQFDSTAGENEGHGGVR